jgi:Uma2 family endonuclease
MVQTLVSPPPQETSQVSWEKLPDDFILPDDPVDNINQPLLAAALSDALHQGGKLSAQSLTTTNYGICARLGKKFVVKAPDWAYIPEISVPQAEVERSYTPKLQGDLPAVVMEFLSETEGGEYSAKPTFPPGKWFFYEQILKVPYYCIFDLKTHHLEVFKLADSGQYRPEIPQAQGRFWLEGLGLFLGVWEGDRQGNNRHWLRWWTEAGDLLLWSSELAQAEKQRANEEKQRADVEKQRADRLAELLRAQGIDPNGV